MKLGVGQSIRYSRRSSPLFVSYRIAGGFPRLFGENGDEWSGASTKRRKSSDNASFHLSFCTLADHPSHILLGRTGRFSLSYLPNIATYLGATSTMATAGEDTSLLARIRSGDETAMAEFLDQRRPQLLAFLHKNLSDAMRRKVDPEDLAQEVHMECVRCPGQRGDWRSGSVQLGVQGGGATDHRRPSVDHFWHPETGRRARGSTWLPRPVTRARPG